jgi:hypothetical protein
MTGEIIELLTVTEAARRLGVVSNTLKRRLARAAIKPDAMLIEGSTGQCSPLFVQERLPAMARLMNVPNPNAQP